MSQIETQLISFLVGAVISYFVSRWTHSVKKLNAMEIGIQCLLRDRMLQAYEFYSRPGAKPVPHKEVESFIEMFEAYSGTNGNGYMLEVKDAFMRLPHEHIK